MCELKTAAETQNTTLLNELQEEFEDGAHENHCFDYVRNGLMCAADTAVEYPEVVPGEGTFRIEGHHILHECKNWVGNFSLRISI
jgi:hypothetical protein